MSLIFNLINIIMGLIGAFGIYCWGNVIKEVGSPEVSLKFFVSLISNRYYIMAMSSGLFASVLRFTVLKKMGILEGGFFLSISTVINILVMVYVLGEETTRRTWLGIAIIILGSIIIRTQ